MYYLFIMQVAQPFIYLLAYIPYLRLTDVLLLLFMFFNEFLEIALAGILHQNAKNHAILRIKFRLALTFDMDELLVEERKEASYQIWMR